MPSAAFAGDRKQGRHSISNQSNHNHTILVVEDVEEISSTMRTALDKRGHHVVHASNAEDAIQSAEVNKPAIILTDLELPTFDKLLSLLNGHTHLKDTVVAIMDLNHPEVDGKVKVLPDFQALDELLESVEPDGRPS